MLIIDANIAAKFVLDELGRVEALERLGSEAVLAAPDWVRIELAHTFWKRVGAGYFDGDAARRNLAAVDEFFDHFIPIADSVPMALGLAIELDHWVYDCLYLACALQVGAPLLTADRKFWNAAKRGGYGDVVELLSWEGQGE